MFEPVHGQVTADDGWYLKTCQPKLLACIVGLECRKYSQDAGIAAKWVISSVRVSSANTVYIISSIFFKNNKQQDTAMLPDPKFLLGLIEPLEAAEFTAVASLVEQKEMDREKYY